MQVVGRVGSTDRLGGSETTIYVQVAGRVGPTDRLGLRPILIEKAPSKYNIFLRKVIRKITPQIPREETEKKKKEKKNKK